MAGRGPEPETVEQVAHRNGLLGLEGRFDDLVHMIAEIPGAQAVLALARSGRERGISTEALEDGVRVVQAEQKAREARGGDTG